MGAGLWLYLLLFVFPSLHLASLALNKVCSTLTRYMCTDLLLPQYFMVSRVLCLSHSLNLVLDMVFWPLIGVKKLCVSLSLTIYILNMHSNVTGSSEKTQNFGWVWPGQWITAHVATEGKITDLVDDQRPRSSSDTYLQQLHLDSSHFGSVLSYGHNPRFGTYDLVVIKISKWVGLCANWHSIFFLFRYLKYNFILILNEKEWEWQ